MGKNFVKLFFIYVLFFRYLILNRTLLHCSMWRDDIENNSWLKKDLWNSSHGFIVIYDYCKSTYETIFIAENGAHRRWHWANLWHFFRGDKIMNILSASSNYVFIDQSNVKISFFKKMNSFLVKTFYLNFFKILNVPLKHLIYKIWNSSMFGIVQKAF